MAARVGDFVPVVLVCEDDLYKVSQEQDILTIFAVPLLVVDITSENGRNR